MLGLMVRTPIKRLLSNMCSGQWLECVPVFPQSQTVPANDSLTIACPNGCDAAKLYFFNNTTYGNTQDPNRACTGCAVGSAEVYLHGVYPQLSAITGGLYSITNNILVSTKFLFPQKIARTPTTAFKSIARRPLILPAAAAAM